MNEPPPALFEAIAQALSEERARDGGTEIDDATFVPYVAARMLDADLAVASLERVHVRDLWLACGCVLGDPASVARFQATHGSAIRAHIARIEPSEVDDLTQRVLCRLLVGEGEVPPRLASYAGRSPLSSWLKVVATREALMHRRRARDPGAAPGAHFTELLDPGDDPELALIRVRHGDDFRRAFQDAFAELDTSERTLLRSQLVDRLKLDEIAAARGVHRATAARHLARIREHLLTRTREILLSRLRLSATQLDSVIRAIHGEVEVSVRRLLDA